MSTAPQAAFPPGPSSPALWQTFRYMTRPHELFEQCRKRYGDIFTLNLMGSGRWVFVATPSLVREVFTAAPKSLETGRVNRSVWGVVSGANAMFTLDREQHVERRRLLVPPFHGEHLRSYVGDMCEVAEDVVATWPRGAVSAVKERMQSITLQVLLRVGFGLREKHKQSALMDALVDVADGVLGSPLLMIPPLQFDWGRFSPWGRLLERVRRMDRLLYAEIARRRASGERGSDVISFLLDVRDESGAGLRDLEIRDELVTMLMAGHDTTEIELTWALRFITARPEIVQQIRAELRDVLGERPIDVEALPQLRYLDAVIRESMRLGPVAPHVAFRHLSAPLKIEGYELPEGVKISVALHLLHRRPDLYEDPLKFQPERFLDGKGGAYEWAPFGGGSRRCIGMAFALWEMKIVLATVIRRLELTPAGKQNGYARSGFFVVPPRGLRVRAENAVRVGSGVCV